MQCIMKIIERWLARLWFLDLEPFCGGGIKTARLFHQGSLNMKKAIFVGLAILAVSTSGALAAKKGAKPKAAAAATATAAPPMMGQVSAADRALYQKSQRESGMKK
jgi:hypothetical protein